VAKVKFTHALSRFFPELKEMEIEVFTIKDLVNELERSHSGFRFL